MLADLIQHASPAHLIGNLVLLAIFGLPVWRALGTVRLIVLLAAAQLGGMLAQHLSDLVIADMRPLIGLSVVGYGLVASYGVLFPAARPLGLPLTGRQIMLTALIITALIAVAAPHGATAHAGHLGGMVGSLMFMQLLEVTRKNT